jgi:16S rRNA (cytosine967-C5)-methyltransferase
VGNASFRVSEPAGLPARIAAQGLLSDVLHKRRPLEAALDRLGHLPRRDAGFARAIASETLRHMGELDALIRAFVAKLPPPHRAGPAFEILLAGACELLFLGVAPHAAVDAANRLAQRDTKAMHFKSLINAVLRRIVREGAAVLPEQDAVRLNTPDWLWSRWQHTYGEERTRAIAQSHLAQPPLDIVLKPDVALEQTPAGDRILFDVLRLPAGTDPESLPGFSGGWWVQDIAASLPARLLGDVCDRNVVDLCAAPGGKTLQLASLGARVVSVDRDEARLERVRQNLDRVGLSAQIVPSDVRDFRPAEQAQLVLLDAPCSATGTIRRHPDLPWIKGAADVTSCAATAAELLESAATMTAAGGILVFSVCSLEPEEGEEQIALFLASHPDFARERVEPFLPDAFRDLVTAVGDLRTLPCHLRDKGGMDGFYAARLRRVS